MLNKIFAIFRSHEYFDKNITVKGWYRRSPVPYVEIKEWTVDGKVKKIYTYWVSKGLYIALGVISIGAIIFGMFGA